MGKIAPINVVLNSAVCVIGAQVRFEQIGVHKGRCHACWDAAKVDWVQWWFGSQWEGSKWEEGVAFVRCIVAWVCTCHNQWRANVTSELLWARKEFVGEDGFHAVGNVG